ncbi:MAG: hypothetical protein GZ091_16005 [Paludibacter sp.]|nr:hypothetical protein [Paludibacter sp.]
METNKNAMFFICSISCSKENSGATYTCVMHPEVNSDKAGKCPKCGMDMVVKK